MINQESGYNEGHSSAPFAEAPAFNQNQAVTITEAAKINGVTRQAIYVAIKQNKLRAQKDSTRWTIKLSDLEVYRRDKYSRSKSTFDGELIFDNGKGYFSVNQVAKILGVPAQKIYYATRVGMLKAIRKGAAWVISEDDINRYRDSVLTRKNGRRKAAS
jgi:excisionase family DNA binding protein